MRTIRALLVAAVAVVGVTACGSGASSHPTNSAIANLPASYLHACEHRASAAVCGCVRQYVNTKVSGLHFTEGEARLVRRGTMPRWWPDAVRACNSK
jgi:hypothetical protein